MRELQNSPLQQNGPFEPFCRSTAKSYSLEYVLGSKVRVAPRPRQTDSKSSIFLGRGVLQFPLIFLNENAKNIFFRHNQEICLLIFGFHFCSRIGRKENEISYTNIDFF